MCTCCTDWAAHVLCQAVAVHRLPAATWLTPSFLTAMYISRIACGCAYPPVPTSMQVHQVDPSSRTSNSASQRCLHVKTGVIHSTSTAPNCARSTLPPSCTCCFSLLFPLCLFSSLVSPVSLLQGHAAQDSCRPRAHQLQGGSSRSRRPHQHSSYRAGIRRTHLWAPYHSSRRHELHSAQPAATKVPAHIRRVPGMAGHRQGGGSVRGGAAPADWQSHYVQGEQLYEDAAYVVL
jgi:hypothetical protein